MTTTMREDLLLTILPWIPAQSWLDSLSARHPNLTIQTHRVDRNARNLPDLPVETWRQCKFLFTWRLFPSKEMVPNLDYVQLLSAGCDQVLELDLFEKTTIDFCTANGVHPPQITEWVFACFLAFQHHVPGYLENQKRCEWVDPVCDEDTEDAVGMKVGILGYGCIGRQCARVAKALGTTVYAYTLHERPTPASRKDESFTEPGLGDPDGEFPSAWYHGSDQLHSFLSLELDLLIVTLPLTSQTRNMLASPEFELLSKKKAYICNVGRGAIINTNDLVAALNEGKIRGAALDVTDPEPLPSGHPLWKAPNTIITPHCSGNSKTYNERCWKILAYNLERRKQGKELVNRVDRKLGY